MGRKLQAGSVHRAEDTYNHERQKKLRCAVVLLLFIVCCLFFLVQLLEFETVTNKVLDLMLNSAETRVLAHRFLVLVFQTGIKDVKSLMSSSVLDISLSVWAVP